MNTLFKSTALALTFTAIAQTHVDAETIVKNVAAESDVKTGLVKASPEMLSLRNEMKLAIKRGNDFLKTKQDAKGFWTDENIPAFTSLVIQAGMLDPNGKLGKTPDHLKKAYSYLESCVQKEGAIYKKGLATYNTSLGIMAFAASGDPKYDQTIINARHFLVNLQTEWKPGPDGKRNIMNGGIGYGGTYPHSDLSNTHLALHAIRTADKIAEDKGIVTHNELNWDEALTFITACQNNETTNEQVANISNDGSFVYFPGNSKAPDVKGKDGAHRLQGYGSMSYAGFLSLIHAKLDSEDERVKTVKHWVSNNYTLKENPGMGLQGLYYYYNVMAKCLTAAGVDELITADGKKINWRKELASHLLQAQKEDGSWINENGRWMESNPVLTTAYVNITLEHIYHSIPK